MVIVAEDRGVVSSGWGALGGRALAVRGRATAVLIGGGVFIAASRGGGCGCWVSRRRPSFLRGGDGWG